LALANIDLPTRDDEHLAIKGLFYNLLYLESVVLVIVLGDSDAVEPFGLYLSYYPGDDFLIRRPEASGFIAVGVQV